MNLIKICQRGAIFFSSNPRVKIRSRLLSVGIKYSVNDVMCDIINYCAFDMGNISVNDIVTKKDKKTMLDKTIFT